MTRQNPGGIDTESLLAQLDKKIAQLKDETRKANEAIQGVKEVMRDARKYRVELEASTQKVVDERVSDAVATGLESFDEALRQAIDTGTARTYARFDELTALLLGETRANTRRGEKSIAELTMQKAGIQPHKHQPVARLPTGELSEDCQDCRFPRSNKEIHPE